MPVAADQISWLKKLHFIRCRRPTLGNGENFFSDPMQIVGVKPEAIACAIASAAVREVV